MYCHCGLENKNGLLVLPVRYSTQNIAVVVTVKLVEYMSCYFWKRNYSPGPNKNEYARIGFSEQKGFHFFLTILGPHLNKD